MERSVWVILSNPNPPLPQLQRRRGPGSRITEAKHYFPPVWGGNENDSLLVTPQNPRFWTNRPIFTLLVDEKPNSGRIGMEISHKKYEMTRHCMCFLRSGGNGPFSLLVEVFPERIMCWVENWMKWSGESSKNNASSSLCLLKNRLPCQAKPQGNVWVDLYVAIIMKQERFINIVYRLEMSDIIGPPILSARY